MAKARDMVDLASSLNAKLIAQEEQREKIRALRPDLPSLTANEPEEAKFIRTSLSQLGLKSAAVTQDMVKDEKQWFEQLAKELGTVLIGSTPREGLMRDRGIVGLDEIWGGWNRARGVGTLSTLLLSLELYLRSASSTFAALIPPETMLLALPHLPMVTHPPISLRTFRSGLRVLHTPEYTDVSFATRLTALIDTFGPRSTVEIATVEKITISLTSEMVESVEEAGDIVRDENPGGEIRWWRNIFHDYTWDGG